MLNETTPERSHSFSQSIEVGLRVASSLGLRTSFTEFGNKLPIYRCDVTDAAGLKIQGKGKGLGDQSIASALFEAIEHYCYVTNEPENSVILKLGEHPLDEEIFDGSPSFSLLSRRRAPPLTRIVFGKMDALGIQIAAPAFLFNPEFKSTAELESDFLRMSGLRHYATNSGTASGTTIEDAQLHAIMELVERDALSLELLATVFASKARPVRNIDRSSLTDHLAELVYFAELETGGTVSIWCIASELKIPAILVRLSDPLDPDYGFFGSGASLYVDYAIERALMEAVQVYHICTSELSKPYLPNSIFSKSSSPYLRCLIEYGRFDYSGGEQNVTLSALNQYYQMRSGLTVKEQIEISVSMLEKSGICVFQRTLLSHEIYVVQLYSPKLERFFLVSAGVFVAPGKRGLKLIDDLK